MEALNDLELSLLNLISIENKEQYPYLSSHIPYLRIQDREYTGVGVYSNFIYINNNVVNNNINKGDALLSSSRRLMIDNLSNELSYVLDITDGKISYLEIVTNGNENWNGTYKNFQIS